MTDCLIVQPIHEAGLSLLREAGLRLHVASNPSLAELLPHLQTARIVITRNLGLSADAISAAPCLKVIGSHGTGVDRIDQAAAAARGIVVINTPGTNARAVAEHALGLMLACARRIPAGDAAVRSSDFAMRERFRMVELAGLVLGVVGYGAVGRCMAKLGNALDMQVVVWSAHAPADEIEAAGLVPESSLDRLVAISDFLTLHTLPGANPLIQARQLATMKSSAILINTARGALVDESALALALHRGHIAAAGLDTFCEEPLPASSPLLDAPNLVMTPHVGGTTAAALKRTALEVARRVLAVPGVWSCRTDK